MLSRGARRLLGELVKANNVRCLSTTPNSEVKPEIPQQSASTFYYDDLDIQLTQPHLRLKKPDPSELQFGKHFSDHMFECFWRQGTGWGQPKICPVHLLQMHPAAKVLHYAQELFEGMKAYRGADGKIRLFRPDMNVKRLLNSAERLGLPTFDQQEFLRSLFRLVDIERDWVPSSPMSSLYLRPTLFGVEPTLGINRSLEALLYVIAGPVGAYYATGVKPVSLLADPQYVRAWPGGTGDKKLGCNYAPTLAVQREAEKLGLHQVLWLFGGDQQITEVGAMNVCVFLRSKDGEPELVTPPLSGIILPGITRRSVLDLTLEWNEFKVSERNITMPEICEALEQNRLMEMFGCGTACIISPIERILYRQGDKCRELPIPTMTNEWQLHARIMRTLQDIQYGIIEHPWTIDLDNPRF